jgi:phage shock protein A
MSYARRLLEQALEDQKTKLDHVEETEADAIADGLDAQRRVEEQQRVVADLDAALLLLDLAGQGRPVVEEG